MKKNESRENYLETILMLSKRRPVVRAVDISNELGFSKASVSIAMKNLRSQDYITVTEDGFIYLTADGLELAQTVYEKHELLTSFLTRLGVSPQVAEEDACRMEHVISAETFQAIKEHVNGLSKNI